MPGVLPREAGKAGPEGTGEGSRIDSGEPGHSTGRSGRRGLRLFAAATSAMTPLALPVAAFAQEHPTDGFALNASAVIQLAVLVGVTGSAILSAIWLIRERGRTAAENVTLRARVADLGVSLRRSEALNATGDRRFVVWTREDRRPEVIGELPSGLGVPSERAAFLAFGRWLAPRSAAALEHALSALRETAKPFDIVVETATGALLEAQGRHAAGDAVLRFASLSEAGREHARLRFEHDTLTAEHDSVLRLVNALDMPFWLRDGDGRLQWVNRAYASAVDTATPDEAVREGREFLGTPARQALARAHQSDPVFAQELSTVVGGDRKVYAVTDVVGQAGSAGIARDIGDIQAIREEYEHAVRGHSDTLNQLSTAVAIFDEAQKLRFFNQAFRDLWELDVAFLESAPDHTLVLDRLRSEGKLEEQPEWRRWKENVLASYRAVDPIEDWWHLPDGRTLRVVANPQPKGGVTWLFENLTEKIDLESRYKTAVRVQGETLDNLAEGVAVFGPDGRLRLSNPAFVTLWNLPDELGAPGVHIGVVRDHCATQAPDNPWPRFVAAATGFDEDRRDWRGQAELVNGTFLRYAVIHLPNGQVMLTFVDVTDSVNVERALKDKNEALQKADRLKDDFVQHVSYELRSPLTNIIGFAELLAMPETGPLNDRQRDYLDHIGSSSSVLLTIVNDILDLATVDAGIMELEIGEVHVAAAVDAAAELVAERLRDHRIALDVDLAGAPQSFHADENRVRQILANLLANAANFAPEDSTITLTARRDDDALEFRVHDDGPGIAPDDLESVFKRFEPRANGGRRRGAGLGLSIVKSFVELHGGAVEIDTGADRGTTVICRFPLAPSGVRVAAE